jgi:hypothetical protein
MTTFYPNETGSLVNGAAYVKNHYRESNHVGCVDWADKRLKRVTRLRLVTDSGFPAWDVSYCHGVLHDGSTCDVTLPFFQLPKKGMARTIVKHAKRDGVHAKRLGILDNISKLW